jgi:hypothetical protein
MLVMAILLGLGSDGFTLTVPVPPGTSGTDQTIAAEVFVQDASPAVSWQVTATLRFSQPPASPQTIAIGGDDPWSILHVDDPWRPYIEAIKTPDGHIVTRGFPMSPRPDESEDHPHHTGLWLAHGLVNGNDYWHDRSCTMALVATPTVTTVAETTTVSASYQWTGPDGIDGTEDRIVRFIQGDGENVIEIDSTFRAVDRPMTFGDTKEGMMAIRMAPTLRITGPVATGHARNSGGDQDGECWGKRARWIEYSGEVNGESVSIRIEDHPENHAYPTWWHARKYGLCAANPFGVHDFEGGEADEGEWTIPKGESRRLRWRFLFRDHPTPQ